MTIDKAEQLQATVAALDRHITLLRQLGCEDTAQILAIARLDLQTKIHEISDDELEAVCNALESGSDVEVPIRVIDFDSHAWRKARSKSN